MTDATITVRSREIEVGHGHHLRVSTVEQPRGGRVLVLQKLTESDRGVPLLDADQGRRVVVAEEDVPELRQLLEDVEEEL